MGDYSGIFLQEIKNLFSPKGGPGIHLGTFGKHPGWDDHMEDLGLETESLLLAKKLLYVEGIGGQINSGEWEKLGTSERLPEFKHIFVWKRGKTLLLGKIWSSVDGKGRSSYPMIVCAHCQEIPLFHTLREVLPVLDELEKLCQQTKSAGEVKQAWAQALEKLRNLPCAKAESIAPENDGTAAFAEKLTAEGGDEMFLRVLYRLHSQLPPGVAKLDGAGDWQDRAARIRLPTLPEWTNQALLYWKWFFEAQFGRRVPIFMTVPVGEPWLDILVGKPSVKDFYPLLVMPKAFAIATEVSYSIDEKFRAENAEMVKAMRQGMSSTKEQPAGASGKKSWISKLLIQE